MKNISQCENVLLDLKFKLHHETILTLTHISTTLSMHWGSWQLDRAEGLGSFASGKEFGSSTRPAFHIHIISHLRTFESILCTVRYKTCHCGRKMFNNQNKDLLYRKFGRKPDSLSSKIQPMQPHVVH